MFHLGGRPEHRGRATAVRPLDRRDALGQRLAGRAAVGQGADHRAEVDVAGRRKHVDVVLAAAGIGQPVNRLEEGLEAALHDVVCSVVVIAVPGRLVEQPLAQALRPFEISTEGGE